jgi:maleylacetate reductase
MQPHSPRQSVIEAANAARASKADLILAVGGGSVIDAAKVALQCLWLGYDRISDLDRLPKGIAPDRSPDVTGAVAPIVRMAAVPTTFSSAEFTSLAGVTNREMGLKEGIDHPLQTPLSVVLDPEATLGVPDWVLMSTGIRAVDHCVEAYCSDNAQPYADAMALHGLRLLSKSLPALKSDPGNLDLRLQCQLGMWLAIQGVAAGVPVGASHGIGRMLGGALGVPHGRTSCVLLPSVLRWNLDVNAGHQGELSAALGKPDKPLADIVEDLVRALAEPYRLRDVGVREDQLRNLRTKLSP